MAAVALLPMSFRRLETHVSEENRGNLTVKLRARSSSGRAQVKRDAKAK